MKISDASFLNDLDGRSACSVCGKSRKYFCYTCHIPLANIADKIPKIRLPCKVDVIKHPREIDGKSTAVHAAVIAPEDVQIYTYPDIPDYSNEGDVLLIFPDKEAIRLEDLWTCLEKQTHRQSQEPEVKRTKPQLPFTRALFIDCTWNQTRKIYNDERVQEHFHDIITNNPLPPPPVPLPPLPHTPLSPLPLSLFSPSPPLPSPKIKNIPPLPLSPLFFPSPSLPLIPETHHSLLHFSPCSPSSLSLSPLLSFCVSFSLLSSPIPPHSLLPSSPLFPLLAFSSLSPLSNPSPLIPLSSLSLFPLGPLSPPNFPLPSSPPLPNRETCLPTLYIPTGTNPPPSPVLHYPLIFPLYPSPLPISPPLSPLPPSLPLPPPPSPLLLPPSPTQNIGCLSPIPLPPSSPSPISPSIKLPSPPFPALPPSYCSPSPFPPNSASTPFFQQGLPFLAYYPLSLSPLLSPTPLFPFSIPPPLVFFPPFLFPLSLSPYPLLPFSLPYPLLSRSSPLPPLSPIPSPLPPPLLPLSPLIPSPLPPLHSSAGLWRATRSIIIAPTGAVNSNSSKVHTRGLCPYKKAAPPPHPPPSSLSL
ncbi:DTW domain-containing protein 1 [Penaeus vannamei]|uniref:tRNA-uridine aminocarboxypropyltransferase 1 n=1 Tax=Penaeus vannamei TaxID=6689 RepID=A0A3R7SLG6_PENVA|nr:DTW domain-containing protein 1 [Penaeus vannamei]